MSHTIVKTTIWYALGWVGQVSVSDELGAVEVAIRRADAPGSTNMELLYDRFARYAFSELLLEFPTQISEENIGVAVLRVINRIIEVYRYVTGESYLETIPGHELRDMEIMTRLDNGQIDLLVTHRMSFGAGLTLANVASVPAKAIDLLRSGDPLPVHSMLLLNAKREKLFENYRMAVVEAETAFEVYVDTVLTSYYRKQGQSATEVDSKLQAGLKNLLKDHLPQVISQPFLGTPEHSRWEKKAYNPRNAVVHDGANCDEQEAEETIAAVEETIKWIQALIR